MSCLELPILIQTVQAEVSQDPRTSSSYVGSKHILRVIFWKNYIELLEMRTSYFRGLKVTKILKNESFENSNLLAINVSKIERKISS